MIKRVCGSYHNLMVYCGFFHILQKLRRRPLPFITCVQFADVWIMSIGVIFREINVAATTGTPKFCTPGFACQKIEIEDFFCADLTCTSSSHCRFFFLIKKPKYLIPPQISRNSKQKLNPFLWGYKRLCRHSTEFCNGKSVSGRNHSFSERKKYFGPHTVKCVYVQCFSIC